MTEHDFSPEAIVERATTIDEVRDRFDLPLARADILYLLAAGHKMAEALEECHRMWASHPEFERALKKGRTALALWRTGQVSGEGQETPPEKDRS